MFKNFLLWHLFAWREAKNFLLANFRAGYSTVAPRYNEPCYNENLVITNNLWKPSRITVKYVETNPAITNPAIANRFWRSQRTIYPAITNIYTINTIPYFVLSLAVSKNDMMIQMVDKPNTTPIGQDRETLTFKALLYLAIHVAVHA